MATADWYKFAQLLRERGFPTSGQMPDGSPARPEQVIAQCIEDMAKEIDKLKADVAHLMSGRQFSAGQKIRIARKPFFMVKRDGTPDYAEWEDDGTAVGSTGVVLSTDKAASVLRDFDGPYIPADLIVVKFDDIESPWTVISASCLEIAS